ncbi:hypothetical protein [Endozoicomonas arenosclerae]|uniref:hypothetical protein n=1 Tax=Endozoicomonas arenosclerae TaxID=1633495 RepID=UPI000AF41CE5|nr:hypothetical protein [Endozoicomonas arenosclerae]
MMEAAQMKLIAAEMAAEAQTAQKHPLIPAQYKKKLLRASSLLTELVEREAARDAKGE